MGRSPVVRRAVLSGCLALLVNCEADPLIDPAARFEGLPHELAFVAQPGAVTAGSAITPAIHVAVLNPGGRPVHAARTVVTVTLTAGTGAPEAVLAGTLTRTATHGVATFDDLTVDKAASAYTLTASSPGLPDATSSAFDVAAGPPAQLVLTTLPSASVQNRAVLATQPVVQLEDAHANPVAKSGIAVTAAVTAGGGTLGGSATATTGASGAATFSDLSIAGPAGAKTLTFSSPGLAGVTAHVTTTAGPASAMVADGGASQAAVVGQPVSTRPTARVTDLDGNGVAGVVVTFAIGTGGGTVTGTTPTTDGAGRATVGGWTPGSLGINTLTASAAGLTGSPLTFSADARAPTLPVEHVAGLSGHFYAGINLASLPADFSYGFSFYSTISTLNPEPAELTQLGWGTWLIPDNRTFTGALCPVGTVARDHWPERGPTYQDVYQTIEGGAGQWGSTQFPSSRPKFRINSTPDCYTQQIASTGWGFGPGLLPPSKLGVAQLSNRVLAPPDGFVFSPAPAPTIVGHGWLALPLIPAYTSPLGVPTGDQSWTLFLHVANFTGPVAFFTPEIWSAVNAVDRTGTGRGHDAQPAISGQVALEIGFTPTFTGRDQTGRRYRRIPRLTFAADAAGRAVLMQDFRFYSKQAIWDGVAAWIQSGTVATHINGAGLFTPSLGGTGAGLRLGGDPVTFDAVFGAGIVPLAQGDAFAVVWAALEPGVVPEYYRDEGGTWRPIAEADVPRETWLIDQTFPAAPRGSFPGVDRASGSPWTSARWSAGPFTVMLGDGSLVEYVWYRFIDQPAIARLGLEPPVLQQLQTFVESLHERSGLGGVTIPGPTGGTLAMLDPAQFVTPPPGLEQGYVPIVIGQR